VTSRYAAIGTHPEPFCPVSQRIYLQTAGWLDPAIDLIGFVGLALGPLWSPFAEDWFRPIYAELPALVFELTAFDANGVALR
jgi:hypothetical protein